MSLVPLSIELLDWCGRIMKSNSKRNPTLRFYLQLFLFIDPGWDIHRKMTPGLFSLDKIKVLPKYPCSHPSKSRSQNKMPWGEWWLNACGHALHVLDASLCNCSISISFSALLPSSLFFVSLPLLYKRNVKEDESNNIFSAILFKHPLGMQEKPLLRLKYNLFACLLPS